MTPDDALSPDARAAYYRQSLRAALTEAHRIVDAAMMGLQGGYYPDEIAPAPADVSAAFSRSEAVVKAIHAALAGLDPLPDWPTPAEIASAEAEPPTTPAPATNPDASESRPWTAEDTNPVRGRSSPKRRRFRG